ncbi:hypothetical protein ACLMJK_005258 [Lecanora helva]
MRVSAWAALLRTGYSQRYFQPNFTSTSCRFTLNSQLHASARRRREDDPPESAAHQVYEDTSNNGDVPPSAEEVVEEGSGRPPKPKDRSNYGSASRRAGRNIKRTKELPPVHIPPWLLSRNISLNESHDLETLGAHKAPPSIEEKWTEDQESGYQSRSNSLTHNEASSEPARDLKWESGKEPYEIDPIILQEIILTAKAGLQVPSWQRAEVAASQRPHLEIYSPQDGALHVLNSIGGLLAVRNQTDFLRLTPQDIAEVGGDYLEDPTEFLSNTTSTLGYDAPLVSAARHAQISDTITEEEESDEADGEEDMNSGATHPSSFQRAGGGAFGGPFGGTATLIGTFGGSMQDMFKSLIPIGGSSQAPKPMIMKGSQQQPKDMTPELKLGLLVETLLNSPEIKREASAGHTRVAESGNGEASEDQPKGGDVAEVATTERQDNASERGNHGLIVLITDYSQISATTSGVKFLNKLHEVVENRRREGQKILIVGTESSKDLMPSLSKTGVKLAQDPRGSMRTVLVPMKEPYDGALETAQKEKIKAINIRHLRDMLRRIASDPSQVAQVVFDWDLDIGSKVGFISGLAESVWPIDRVGRIATTALGLLAREEELTSKHIEAALEIIETSDSSKVEWAQEEKKRRKKKTTGPPNSTSPQEDSKERIRGLRKTCNEHEKKLLNGIVHPEDIRTTFTDVHAPQATIDALKTLTSLSLVRPDAFTYGVLATDKIPGLLMYGPPGTGKTLLARAVAKESGAIVLEVSGSDVYDMYVGEGEKNVRAIFSLAKKLAPCIVFIDEADAILGARSGGSNRTSHRELINQFLREWDGMTEMSAFIMVATNRPFDLDEASLRRLPRRLLVDLPVEKDREAILQIHLKDELLSPDVSLSQLASQTPFYSGSDLKNVAVAAALACVREEFDAAAAHAKDTNNKEIYQYAEKRTLHPRHFAKAMEEISASISEDMGSLSAIRKFDEKYGDRRGRRKKGGYGFRTVNESEKVGSDAARVRNQT